MDGAAHRSESALQSILNLFGDAVRCGEIIHVHHHVHVNENPLTQNASAGDVMTIQHPWNSHGLSMDRFGCDGDVINKPGQVVPKNMPANTDQNHSQGHGQNQIEPVHLEEPGTGQPDQHEHSGPDVAGGVIGVSQKQLTVQLSSLTTFVTGQDDVEHQHDEQQQKFGPVDSQRGQAIKNALPCGDQDLDRREEDETGDRQSSNPFVFVVAIGMVAVRPRVGQAVGDQRQQA